MSSMKGILRPNFAALVPLLALSLFWYALSPTWDSLSTLFAPVLSFVGFGLMVLTCLLTVVVSGFAIAVVGMLLGGVIPRLR